MRCRIDGPPRFDLKGAIVVPITYAADGEIFPASASGMAVLFSTKEEIALFIDRPPVPSREETIKIVLAEWQKVDPTLDDPALAAGKVGEQPAAKDVVDIVKADPVVPIAGKA